MDEIFRIHVVRPVQSTNATLLEIANQTGIQKLLSGARENGGWPSEVRVAILQLLNRPELRSAGSDGLTSDLAKWFDDLGKAAADQRDKKLADIAKDSGWKVSDYESRRDLLV